MNQPGSVSQEITAWTPGWVAVSHLLVLSVVAALFISSPDQTWLLWVHACFFGLTWGARGPMITAKTADLFQGRLSFAKTVSALVWRGVRAFREDLGAALGSR